MKFLCYIFSALICAQYVSSWVVPQNQPIQIDTVTKVPHLGEHQCTWGPSFWCSNITNAKSCKAVTHCIKNVWEHQTLPPDHDSVCEICTKMVKQARDQLESNETQEEIKEVFEGSCKLIPLSIISNECIKLVDDFVPELVETLASQMNPQVVCATAGLCNNPRIDQLLAQSAGKKVADDQCDGCHTVIKKLRNNFDASSRDQVLQGILRICGRMGSFSDGCTNIILNNFENIYSHLKTYLDPKDVCIMTGSCYLQFHVHEVDVEITPMSENGKVQIETVNDDLPCKFCEQLVQHLRELLIANTTELEFQQVLRGLCKQTGNFKDECMAIVDTYYPQIYNFLVAELDPAEACSMLGLCPNDKKIMAYPFAPLLPVDTAEKAVKILGPELSMKKDFARVKLEKSDSNVRILSPELAQLPIERMMPPALTLQGNTKMCALCEYFLHFVQTEITDPKNEAKLKQIVDRACEKLPKTIGNECVNFVDEYGDGMVALLAQELDPSQICPLLSVCKPVNLKEVEVIMKSKPNDKPNCPLCLFAVTQLEEMIKNHKTKETIENALKGLCKHLPNNLAPECEDFVATYTDELVEMLVADMTPQEVCVFLKLCNATPSHQLTAEHPRPWAHIEGNGEEFEMTNEIPDDTIEGKKVTHLEKMEKISSPQCVICEFIMSQIDNELKDRTNEEHIKQVVHNVCNHLPKTVSKDCNDFVDKYADVVIKFLVQEMEPHQICSIMMLCSAHKIKAQEEILECAICETVVLAIDKLLDNPDVEKKAEHILKKACLALPSKYEEKCEGMVDAYGLSFIKLIEQFGDGRLVCHKVGLCANEAVRPKRDSGELLGANKCMWGPAFWCTEEAKDHGCHHNDDEFCKEYLSKRNS